MLLVSASYIIFLLIVCIIFYLCPIKYRKWILLPASLFFFLYQSGKLFLWLFYSTFVAWGYGLSGNRNKRRDALLACAVILELIPLVGFKFGGVFSGSGTIAVPVGISFYTLSLIGYCIDVYRGKYAGEENFGRFLLFSSFFPHIVQGPIARYDALRKTLFSRQKFHYDSFCKGIQLILWGFMLKLIIADRAALLVDQVFGSEGALRGTYVLLAFVTYSFQLYADFQACVCIAQGTAQLFGIRLEHNFRQPYFAVSVQDFWRRWHISLSTWLRDYVYIPLGGSRKGTLRRYGNILLVFLISGLWHGTGIHFLVWGMLHGIFQIAEGLAASCRMRFLPAKESRAGRWLRRIITYALVTFAWGIFRADSVGQFLRLLRDMFAVFNPQILLTPGAFEMSGLRMSSYVAVLAGMCVVFLVDLLHERGIRIRDRISGLALPIRWTIYAAAVLSVLIFGMYGPGYSASQFIYGQF